jgi:hypothetical protein
VGRAFWYQHALLAEGTSCTELVGQDEYNVCIPDDDFVSALASIGTNLLCSAFATVLSPVMLHYDILSMTVASTFLSTMECYKEHRTK